jgi:hypothetical protein
MYRTTEFGPNLEISGSASRRSHVAVALADWDHVFVYCTAAHGSTKARLDVFAQGSVTGCTARASG